MKKTLTFLFSSLFVVWMIGAGISFIYTEFERRYLCVEEKGIIKGLLFCDEITPRWQLGDRSLFHRTVNSILWPIRIIKTNSYENKALWKTQDSFSSISLVKKFDDSSLDLYITLSVSFDHELGCIPEIGVYVSENLGYGDLIRQHPMEEKLKITINNKLTFSRRAVQSLYSNGVEALVVGTEELVNKMKNGKNATVSIDGLFPQTSFPLEGASKAIDMAEKSCLSKL